MLERPPADEAGRIRETYARQGARWQETKYRGWMPGNLLAFQERERVMLDLLRKHGYLPLTSAKVLEVGCAAGKTLLPFLRYGVRPENLVGVDLLEHEIEQARALMPHLRFEVADARELPFEADSFDLVVAFTVFSSILDPEIRRLVAGEMTRVLRPGGAALVYDFRVKARTNADTCAIPLDEVRKLFPSAQVDARRLTLAPPLARAIAPRSWLACELLAKLPSLRTHWLALVTSEEASGSRPGS